MIMANENVIIEENIISGNATAGILVVSYLEEYENYSFEATTYVKVNNDIMDYDFKAENCLPPKTDNPKKAKKIYKKWIKKGY